MELNPHTIRKAEFVAKPSKSDPRKSSDRLALTIPRFRTWDVDFRYLLMIRNEAGIMKKNKAKLTRATSPMREFV